MKNRCLRLLRILFAVSATYLLALSSTCASTEQLLIRDVTIVSPVHGTSAEAVDVLITDGAIVKIGPSLQADTKNVIDGGGKFLTPGLIDSHTHLSSVPGMSYPQMQANPDVTAEAKKQIPLSYLYHGFTTVIDLHSEAEMIREWNQRDIRPTAYFCGAAPIMDGYTMNFIPKEVRYQVVKYFLLGNNAAPKGVNPDNHTPEAVVKRMQADGAICVKTHFESGFGGRGNLPTPSLDLIRELRTAANSNGMKLFLHANSEQAQRFGVDAAVDAFAHGMWTWSTPGIVRPSDSVKEVISEAVDKGIKLQPTVQVLYGERDLHNPDYLKKPELSKVLPPSLLKWYASDEGQSFRREMQALPFVAKLLEESNWQSIDQQGIARVVSTMKAWTDAGGSLLFGSDTPSDITFANPPGLNGRTEIEHWSTAGVTLDKIFAAATIDNARFFGLDDQLGTVEVGKRADLLLLARNPLVTQSAYDSIEHVISNGVAIERNELAADR